VAESTSISRFLTRVATDKKVTIAANTALAVTSLVVLTSGAITFAAALVPFHCLAAYHARRVAARAAWAALAAAAAGGTTWAVTYMVAGESEPVIWGLPLVIAVGTGGLIFRFASGKQASKQDSSGRRLGGEP